MLKLSDHHSWYLLVALTLSSALIGEATRPEGGLVLFICGTIAIKGQLVMDNLMGLRDSHNGVRIPMRLYFIVLTVFISLAILFPAQLERLTTL